MKDFGLYALLIGAWVVLPLLIVLWANGFFKRLPPEEKAKDRFSLRLTPTPKKRSYTNCPWCLSQIEVARRSDKAFQCPVCGCAFRHNYKKWVIAIPIALALCILLPRPAKAICSFIPPVVCLFAGLIATFFATRRIPDYNIVIQGMNPPPPPTLSMAVVENEKYQASRHISIHRPKQLAAVLTVILTPIAIIVLGVWIALR